MSVIETLFLQRGLTFGPELSLLVNDDDLWSYGLLQLLSLSYAPASIILNMPLASKRALA